MKSTVSTITVPPRWGKTEDFVNNDKVKNGTLDSGSGGVVSDEEIGTIIDSVKSSVTPTLQNFVNTKVNSKSEEIQTAVNASMVTYVAGKVNESKADVTAELKTYVDTQMESFEPGSGEVSEETIEEIKSSLMDYVDSEILGGMS